MTLANGETLACDQLLLATGGCRAASAGELAVSLGHTLEPPVPSLFTFHIDTPWVRELSGVSVPSVAASVPETKLREQGALLLTHWGLSGPVILRLSAWGARVLHGLNYRFPLLLNWLPNLDAEKIATELRARARGPARPIDCQHSDCRRSRAACGNDWSLAAGIPPRNALGRLSRPPSTP